MGAPYFAAFSAGDHPSPQGYYNDGPSDHPDNFIHFPAVLGFGQLGKNRGRGWRLSWPIVMVMRRTMVSSGDDNINMLTRWSMTSDYPGEWPGHCGFLVWRGWPG